MILPLIYAVLFDVGSRADAAATLFDIAATMPPARWRRRYAIFHALRAAHTRR